MSCKKRVRHTGTTNRVDTRLDHSPAGALAHALQTLGCPAVIRSVSRSALAPKSGASTAKASQAARDAPHPASGAREHSRCARDSVLPWVGRSPIQSTINQSYHCEQDGGCSSTAPYPQVVQYRRMCRQGRSTYPPPNSLSRSHVASYFEQCGRQSPP